MNKSEFIVISHEGVKRKCKKIGLVIRLKRVRETNDLMFAFPSQGYPRFAKHSIIPPDLTITLQCRYSKLLLWITFQNDKILFVIFKNHDTTYRSPT